MKRRFFASCYLILVLVMFMNVNMGYAGSTGKIAGSIIDAETKEPLPGVNVQLAGTYLGAATDEDGFFSIINIPPGKYDLQVSMIGYKETVIQQLQVQIDLTTTINIDLQSAVLESEAVVVVAERPLVQKDLTSSIASVSAEEISILPVQSIGDILELQAGVVRDGSGFHVRGGRANEVTFLVDGIDFTDAYNGTSMGTTVETNAIQEMQLVSGTFNAEYGKAMSGIVSIVTKEGTPNYSGKLNVYAGDYVTSDDLYAILESTDQGPVNEKGRVTEIEHLRYPLNDLNLTLNTDFTLSGPIPGLEDKLSFFVNGRYVQRDGYRYGMRLTKPQGYRNSSGNIVYLPDDSSLVAMDYRETYSTLAKLTYRISPAIKLNYQFLWDDSYRPYSGYSRDWKYTPDGRKQDFSNSTTHMVTFTHTLSTSTFYEMRFAGMHSESKSYLYEDPTKTPGYLISTSGDSTGAGALLFNPYSDEGSFLLDSLQQNDVTHSWVVDPDNNEGYVESNIRSGTGTSGYTLGGTDNNHSYREYGFLTAKFDLTSQIDNSHQIKAGVEGKYHELKRDNYNVIGDANESFIFKPVVPGVNSLRREIYTYNPIEMSAYFQDKIELDEMIINLGVRFDYFDADATIPSDIRDPDIYDPIRDENRYKNFDKDLYNTLTQVEKENYVGTLEEYTPGERAAFMRKDVKGKLNISPRIGVSFPITSTGIIHFSYGHFLGMPGFSYLYNSSDYKLAAGNNLVGNADLEPEKTVHYEVGLQQQLGNDVGLDLTLFYKDTRGWVGASPLYKTYSAQYSYSKYENKDYSNVYGMTLDLEKRFGNMFAARVYYAYQLAEGTYSDPNDAFDQVYNSGDPNEPRLALVPMGWDQRHTANAYVTMNLESWTFTLTARYLSGRPYTPTVSKGENTGVSSYVGWTANSERVPSSSSVDLRVLKSFPIGEFRINAYAVVYNLFDQRGITGVFSNSGLPDFNPDLYRDYTGYSATRVGSYQDNLRRPGNYQAPREVQLGFSLSF